MQNKCYVKKCEIRNKKIEGLNADIAKIKEDFYDFRKNSTMDAYFKKYTDVIMRTGRQEKDYLKELVHTVDDFLTKTDTGSLDTIKMAEERAVSKDAEPSGVDAMLVGIQMRNTN